MTSFISHTSVDCRNAYELSEWWKQVLAYVDVAGDPNEPGHEECMIVPPGPGQGPVLLFIEVPEPKQVKNRIHFDLRPAGGATRDEEVATLIGLGATRRRRPARHEAAAWAGWCWPTRRATSSASCAARRRWPADHSEARVGSRDGARPGPP